jgi:hypothetical protein
MERGKCPKKPKMQVGCVVTGVCNPSHSGDKNGRILVLGQIPPPQKKYARSHLSGKKNCVWCHTPVISATTGSIN